MNSHGLIPYLNLTFHDEQKHCWRSNQRIALISTSSSQSTMELSTYKTLFPEHYTRDDESDHNYSILTNPHKSYSVIAHKLIECTFYVTTDKTTELPIKTKIYIISDSNKQPPDIVIGTNILLDKSLITSLTSDGIRMNDKNQTLIPYYYISRTSNPLRSISYRMLSPDKAKVRTIPTVPYNHQNFQIAPHHSVTIGTTDEQLEQIASPNHRPTSPREFQYGRTNLNQYTKIHYDHEWPTNKHI